LAKEESKYKAFSTCSIEYVDKLKRIADDPAMVGIELPPGMRKALGKLRMGEVTILGGFEGHGKSALAQQMAFYAAQQFIQTEEQKENGERPCAVLMASLEMGWEQVMARAIAQNSMFPYTKLMQPEMIEEYEWPIVEQMVETIKQWPVIIYDSAVLKTSRLLELVQDLRIQMDIKLVVIDYLQLLSNPIPEGGSETARLDEIIRDIKELARSQSCHVIALSSLNRQLGDSYLPSALNIRGSGGVAYGADNVTILHRPYVIDKNLDDKWEKVALFMVVKQRNGPSGHHHLKWNDQKLIFEEMSEYEIQRLPDLPVRRGMKSMF
jgi:replicative DNA helicase